jgi:hypothetical protein
MRKTRRIMIAKREGALEPFETAKLRRCLAAALKACNRDTRIAEALARAVELHLREWSEARPPTTDYIFRCLHSALTGTGMEQVAQHLARHHRHRAQQRQKLFVFDACQSRRAPTPWRKSEVTATLEHRHGLSHSVARILAGEIERRVLALEYRAISTALIVELIRSELLAWGLANQMTSPAPLAPEVDVVTERQTRKEC